MSVNMEDFGANEQTMDSGNEPAKKGGRKGKLSPAERHEHKLESGRKYRRNKVAENQALQKNYQTLQENYQALQENYHALQEKNQELEKENKKLTEEKGVKQSEINSSKEEILENIARADNLGREVFDAKEQAEASGHKPAKKGGRKPMLREHQKRENKIKSCKNYRLRKADKYKRLDAENKSLKEKMEVLRSNINSLNEGLSETKARANKLEKDLSDRFKIMHEQKEQNEALNSPIEQMQHDFLDWDVQDHHVTNLESNNIISDRELFEYLENLEDFTNIPDLDSGVRP